MNLKKVCMEFDEEEIEALYFCLGRGLINSDKLKYVGMQEQWMKMAEEIRRILPTKLNFKRWKIKK